MNLVRITFQINNTHVPYNYNITQPSFTGLLKLIAILQPNGKFKLLRQEYNNFIQCGEHILIELFTLFANILETDISQAKKALEHRLFGVAKNQDLRITIDFRISKINIYPYGIDKSLKLVATLQPNGKWELSRQAYKNNKTICGEHTLIELFTSFADLLEIDIQNPDGLCPPCTCPTECDCQDPEKGLNSNHCPTHNNTPEPDPECPQHNMIEKLT